MAALFLAFEFLLRFDNRRDELVVEHLAEPSTYSTYGEEQQGHQGRAKAGEFQIEASTDKYNSDNSPEYEFFPIKLFHDILTFSSTI